MNLEKTNVSFSSGVVVKVRSILADGLGVRFVNSHEKYLGLPIVIGRSKKVISKGVKEKFWKKLQGWKGMLLSKAGREILIKAIV